MNQRMKLELDGEVIDQRLSNTIIRSTLERLEENSDSFVILSQDDMTYLQVAGNSTVGFTIEYQDGSLAEHYQCTNAEVSAADLVQTFQSYFTGDDRWRSALAWEKFEPGEGQAASVGKPSLRTMFLVISAMVVLWMIMTLV